MTYFIPVRSHSVPFTHRHTHTQSFIYTHISACMNGHFFWSNWCRSSAHSYLICAGDGKDTGACLSGPEGWAGEKAPCHYVREKMRLVFQENETWVIPDSPRSARIEGQSQCAITIQFDTGISNTPQENSRVSTVSPNPGTFPQQFTSQTAAQRLAGP